jgi:septal ring factor EnvC (AmiA/AmiB activator)
MLNANFPNRLRAMELARHAETRAVFSSQIAQERRALEDERKRNDGLTKELAEATEKVRVLEAKLTTARSELLKALHAPDLKNA